MKTLTVLFILALINSSCVKPTVSSEETVATVVTTKHQEDTFSVFLMEIGRCDDAGEGPSPEDVIAYLRDDPTQ